MKIIRIKIIFDTSVTVGKRGPQGSLQANVFSSSLLGKTPTWPPGHSVATGVFWGTSARASISPQKKFS